MVGGFALAVWPVSWIRLVMEAAVGQGSTETLVEEEKQKRDLEAFAVR